MTKEYLKMADEFSLPVKYDTLEVYCRQHIGESFGSGEVYTAHAINSHDELVAEVERLRSMIDALEKEHENIIANILDKASALGVSI